MAKERWKQVLGFEGYYEVSNRGRVRSIAREIVDKNGRRRRYKGKMLKLWAHSRGYPVCQLQEHGNSRLVAVHILVLEAFVGPAPEGHEAHHNNRDRSDNRLVNLGWMDAFEHKSLHKKNATEPEGMFQPGEANPHAKLTEKQVLEIYELGKSRRHGKIAKLYGIERSTISGILSGRIWKYLYAQNH